eukprot:1151812-Pelagomonas_calceolata.AAC.5
MIADLTKMSISNASLLDEATAAAEAMTMCSAIARGKKPKFLVSVGAMSVHAASYSNEDICMLRHFFLCCCSSTLTQWQVPAGVHAEMCACLSHDA